MPYLSGFHYRKPIKIASAGIPASTLSAFIKLLSITADTDIGAILSTQKLAVTLADGTTLAPYGSLAFSSSGGAASINALTKLDLASTLVAGDTIAYLYYDEDGTDQSNKTGVVSGASVYLPLEEDPSGSAPQMLDWTGSHNATSAGSMTSGDSVSGQLVKALDFDGTNDYLDFSGTGVQPQDFTICCMVKQAAIVGTWSCVFSNNAATVRLMNNADGKIYLDVDGRVTGGPVNTGFSYTPNVWQHYCLTSTSGSTKLYVDGVLRYTSTTVGAISYPGGSWYIGCRYSGGPGLFFIGQIDNFLIAPSVWTADRVLADYTDKFANSTTFTLGAEETDVVPSSRRTGMDNRRLRPY